MKVDFGKAAEDYGRHRAGFPDSFFGSLQEKGLIAASASVVDLGTGTGTIARGLSKMGCAVNGVDPSRNLLKEAAQIADEESLRIDWIEGKAENTGLPDACADVITAGQCWHWFDAPAAIREIRRVLKPDGRLIVAHFDWLPTPENVAWHTEQLIHELSPGWELGGGVGIYPDLFRHFEEGGVKNIVSYSYDEQIVYPHEAWRGRIRASAGVGGSHSSEKVAAFDQQLKEVLEKYFPEDPLLVPHRVFVITGEI